MVVSFMKLPLEWEKGSPPPSPAASSTTAAGTSEEEGLHTALFLTFSRWPSTSSPGTSEEEGLAHSLPPHTAGNHFGGGGTGPPPHTDREYLEGGRTSLPLHTVGKYFMHTVATCANLHVRPLKTWTTVPSAPSCCLCFKVSLKGCEIMTQNMEMSESTTVLLCRSLQSCHL